MSTSIPRTRRPRGPNSRNTQPLFGFAAPPTSLLLPKALPITLVELIVYLPNSLRNYFVLLRLIQAGLDQTTTANIVNLHRTWEKWPALANSICHMNETTMRKGCGHTTWTMRDHMKGVYDEQYGYEWDDDDLTLNGVVLDCEMDPKYREHGARINAPTENVPFAALAAGVAHHPSYELGDGYMLTRCVQYAAQNPHKEYMFPRDFGHLIEKLDDGRGVKQQCLDRACVKRWERKNSWWLTERAALEAEDFMVYVEESEDENEMEDDDEETEADGEETEVDGEEMDTDDPALVAAARVFASLDRLLSDNGARYPPSMISAPTPQVMQSRGHYNGQNRTYSGFQRGAVVSSPQPFTLPQQLYFGQRAPQPIFQDTSSFGNGVGVGQVYGSAGGHWYDDELHGTSMAAATVTTPMPDMTIDPAYFRSGDFIGLPKPISHLESAKEDISSDWDIDALAE